MTSAYPSQPNQPAQPNPPGRSTPQGPRTARPPLRPLHEITELRHGVEELRTHWLWFILLGIALIILGFFALGSVVVASLATAIAIGWLLVFAGLIETLATYWVRGWSGFFFHLLSGLLSIAVGLLFLRSPTNALLALTMLLACLLMVGGAFKIIAAANFLFAAWAWPLASGIIDVILGLLIWLNWPGSALWVLGLFLGINLLFRGFNWIGLGLALNALRQRGGEQQRGGADLSRAQPAR